MMKIPHSEFVCFEEYLKTHPIRIDLVYAQPKHKNNLFKEQIYKADAKLWCHRDLADLTLRAAKICFDETGYIFEIKDSLRCHEAQARMQETDIVKRNPHWCMQPNRLLSPPGKGGHPRGMAIDIILTTNDGHVVDMGTPFDYLTEDRNNNPAARDYMNFPDEILKNRKILEGSMMQAASDLNRELLPLPQEWWDFRFPNTYTEKFDPVFDADLPSHMKMMP